MSNNPLINAGAAAAYIAGGVTIGFYVGPRLGSLENTIAAPILMLSLLVFSVAVMGFLFFSRPVALLLEGKGAEAAKLFLQTLGLFAVFIILLLSALVFLARP